MVKIENYSVPITGTWFIYSRCSIKSKVIFYRHKWPCCRVTKNEIIYKKNQKHFLRTFSKIIIWSLHRLALTLPLAEFCQELKTKILQGAWEFFFSEMRMTFGWLKDDPVKWKGENYLPERGRIPTPILSFFIRKQKRNELFVSSGSEKFSKN